MFVVVVATDYVDIKRCANYFHGVPAVTETCRRHVGDKSDDVSSGAPSKTCLVKTFPTKTGPIKMHSFLLPQRLSITA